MDPKLEPGWIPERAYLELFPVKYRQWRWIINEKVFGWRKYSCVLVYATKMLL